MRGPVRVTKPPGRRIRNAATDTGWESSRRRFIRARTAKGMDEIVALQPGRTNYSSVAPVFSILRSVSLDMPSSRQAALRLPRLRFTALTAA